MRLALLGGACLWWLAASALAAPLVVIVAPQHAGVRLDRAELALVFQRKRQYWPGGGGRIQPVNLPARHPLRLRFSQAVLGASPAALEAYWNERYFHGIRPPYVVPSADAMLRFVAETPAAIGYLDACTVPASAAVAVIALIDADGQLQPADHLPPCSGAAAAAPPGRSPH